MDFASMYLGPPLNSRPITQHTPAHMPPLPATTIAKQEPLAAQDVWSLPPPAKLIAV